MVGWGAFADSKTGGMSKAMFEGNLADAIRNAEKIKAVGYLGSIGEISVMLLESKGNITPEIAAKIATLISIMLVGDAVVGAVTGIVASRVPQLGMAAIITAMAITATVMEQIFNTVYGFIFSAQISPMRRNRGYGLV